MGRTFEKMAAARVPDAVFRASRIWVRRSTRKGRPVNLARGIMMLVAAALALWKGFQIHHGETALFAYGLGVLALALGIWHLTHRAPQRRT
jgi:Flp pilus assembly protein TadB